jgi:hypothetical protein
MKEAFARVDTSREVTQREILYQKIFFPDFSTYGVRDPTFWKKVH